MNTDKDEVYFLSRAVVEYQSERETEENCSCWENE